MGNNVFFRYLNGFDFYIQLADNGVSLHRNGMSLGDTEERAEVNEVFEGDTLVLHALHNEYAK